MANHSARCDLLSCPDKSVHIDLEVHVKYPIKGTRTVKKRFTEEQVIKILEEVRAGIISKTWHF